MKKLTLLITSPVLYYLVGFAFFFISVDSMLVSGEGGGLLMVSSFMLIATYARASLSLILLNFHDDEPFTWFALPALMGVLFGLYSLGAFARLPDGTGAATLAQVSFWVCVAVGLAFARQHRYKVAA